VVGIKGETFPYCVLYARELQPGFQASTKARVPSPAFRKDRLFEVIIAVVGS